MKRTAVVIGANYGDEGKGKIVDFLCSRLAGNAVVVRFNGGAQAGHTVVLPDGTRHVFHHFGAGTFAGAATYCAKHFVLNPVILFHEVQDLLKLGAAPVIAADPRCYVTTPWDMTINQNLEDARGAKRHGSVGLGFGETIERNRFATFRITLQDLADNDFIETKLRLIRDQWVPSRCQRLKIPTIPRDDALMSNRILRRTVEMFQKFRDSVQIAGFEYLEGRPLVFEGAQGLGLDMDRGDWPHVTRSNTGLENVMPLQKVLRLRLQAIYVTRPYLTRHGAGPLRDEVTPKPPIVDETNLPHPYQGTLRFGKLHMDDLLRRIKADSKALRPMFDKVTTALTCTDHIAPHGLAISRRHLPNLAYTSHGPRRDQTEVDPDVENR